MVSLDKFSDVGSPVPENYQTTQSIDVVLQRRMSGQVNGFVGGYFLAGSGFCKHIAAAAWAASSFKYLLWLRHWFQCSPVRPVKSTPAWVSITVNAVSLVRYLQMAISVVCLAHRRGCLHERRGGKKTWVYGNG
jgi:hypothetical protein